MTDSRTDKKSEIGQIKATAERVAKQIDAQFAVDPAKVARFSPLETKASGSTVETFKGANKRAS